MKMRNFKEEPTKIVRHQQNDEQGSRQMTEVEIFTPDALKSHMHGSPGKQSKSGKVYNPAVSQANHANISSVSS